MLDDTASDDDLPEADDVSEILDRRRSYARRDLFGEQFFGIFGPSAARLGWAVYPQERDDKRRPCVVDDERLKWSRYQDVGMPADEVDRIRHQVLGENVAVILGRASGNVFALDIDVSDEAMAWQIEEIADETLGPSNWRRIGNAPKRSLFYRTATAEEIPAWSRHVLVDDAGQPSGHMIEILGQGRSITVFGRHWKTRLPFNWDTGFSPISDGPEAVPVVTREQLDAFLAAVEAQVRPFHHHSVSVSDFTASAERYDGTVVIPSVRLEYPKDAAGLIVDHRDVYLWQLCKLTCRRNADAVLTKVGLVQVQAGIMEEFKAAAAMTGKWSDLNLRVEVAEKTTRLAAQIAAGTLQPMRRAYVPKSTAAAPKSTLPDGFFDTQATLRWLPATTSKVSILAADEGFNVASRAIDETPEAESACVAAELDAGLDRILDDLLADREEGDDAPAHLLKVPTGAGKTSRLIAKLGDRSVVWREERGEPLRGVLALPSHANADEALARAHDAGLVAMVYRGKLRPGMCARQDVIRELSEAGIGTSGICHARVKNPLTDEDMDVYCPFFGTCAYQAQKREVADCDLVIVPHAYIGLGKRMPEVLTENARFVIVDEDLSGTVLHTAAMPTKTLTLPRKPPYLTKKEKAVRVDPTTGNELPKLQPEDLLFDRAEACRIALEEVQAGRDPALALLTTERGLELIDSSIAVTGRTNRFESKLTPYTSIDTIRDFAGMVRGSHIREEWRFWTLMRERYLHLQLDLVATQGGNMARVAKGATDLRVRRVRRWIRMAWLSEPALRSLPVLHMDASAEERVVRKIVGRALEVTEIRAKIRQVTTLIPDATYSKSSLLPRVGETLAVKVRKGKRMQRIREAVAYICAHHGDGEVFLVASQAVEDHLTDAGKLPGNLRLMHYGNTKGLDYAKGAVAMITIGDRNARLENYDDLACALTYDEDTQEPLMVDADGGQAPYRTVQELVPMRDGRSVVLDVCRFEGDAAATFQRSIRDHEILQAWGRLRPVHRAMPGHVYHFGRTVPDGTVIDAVVSLDDLVSKTGLIAEGIVDCHGILVRADAAEMCVERRFDDLVAAIDANAMLHPGLTVVRDGDGSAALITRTAAPEAREVLQRQGYDLAAVPAPAAKAMTDADVAREEEETERRVRAWDRLLQVEEYVSTQMVQDAAGLWWMPAGVDWGLNRKGEKEAPVPMTWREAVQCVRRAVLPAIVADAEDDEAEKVGTCEAAGPAREVDISWLDEAA